MSGGRPRRGVFSVLILIREIFFFFKEKYEEENNTRVFPTMWNHEANILLHLLPGSLIVYICKVTRCPLPLNFFLRKTPNT